ncbi:hypothetical protein JS278_02926 [Acidipropionibacterium virtanenii]|uniref:Uncharacterized protein n=2 Tax=Acidipropionibacterium virtanenii TaxID=2057246 RepID=A0A344UXR2_9ACTN|nr:hypothetical protein JS278_02926 [Acidipropionibacterium virtanenii]
MIDSSGYLSAQAVILLLQVSALVWGIVHAARLARVRRRLALSLDDVAPPPPDYINAVQLDDARLYRRDDRTPVVRALVAGLAWVSRFLDDLGRGADDFTPAPSSGQIQQTFNARRSPRRGFVSAICLLTLAWLGLTVLTFGPISDRIPGDASLLIVIVASGAVQLGVLFIIGGVRMSIDSSFRKRIFRLRRESAALTARAPIKRSRHP